MIADFKVDKKLELRRKILHISVGILIILSAVLIPQIKWILFFALIFGIFLSVVSVYYELPVISFLLEKFERPYYKKVFPGKGLLFFVAGSLLVLKLFPKEIALASIAIITFSDPLFSFGKRVFKGIFKLKNFKSMILGFAGGAIAAIFFVSPIKALIASFFAAITESFAIYLGADPVDDNILIPLAAGTVLYLLPI